MHFVWYFDGFISFSEAWIGLSSHKFDNEWYWVDGSVDKSGTWGSSEPTLSMTGYDCTVINTSSSGMNSSPCTIQDGNPLLCQSKSGKNL